ncbi:hypothetical protein D3C87_1069880 [compost metagenome]
MPPLRRRQGRPQRLPGRRAERQQEHHRRAHRQHAGRQGGIALEQGPNQQAAHGADHGRADQRGHRPEMRAAAYASGATEGRPMQQHRHARDGANQPRQLGQAERLLPAQHGQQHREQRHGREHQRAGGGREHAERVVQQHDQHGELEHAQRGEHRRIFPGESSRGPGAEPGRPRQHAQANQIAQEGQRGRRRIGGHRPGRHHRRPHQDAGQRGSDDGRVAAPHRSRAQIWPTRSLPKL